MTRAAVNGTGTRGTSALVGISAVAGASVFRPSKSVIARYATSVIRNILKKSGFLRPDIPGVIFFSIIISSFSFL